MRLIPLFFAACLLAFSAFSATAASSVPIGGEFSLTDQHGKNVKSSAFKGRYLLVFFGFTHCPDICPVTIATMSKTLELLGKKADQVVPIFITVDPERDTPAVMKNYLAPFDSRIIGLTGSKADIKKTADAYKIFFSKKQLTPEGHGGHGDHYTVDHSTIVYMIDPDGNYLRHFSYNIGEKELAEGISEHLK
jgi:protein SCO1